MFAEQKPASGAVLLILCLFVIQVSSQQLHQTTVIPNLNSSLPIEFTISPTRIHHGSIFVVSKTVINATAVLPPSHLNTTYKWSTKQGVIQTQPDASTINVTFTSAIDHQFLRVEVFRGNATANETGSSQVDFSVMDATKIKDIKGKVFLEHGELLDTKIILEGSPPLRYCFNFCYDKLAPPCESCYPFLTTNGTEVLVTNWYLRYVGSYVFMFYVENLVNSDKRTFAIRINESVREQKMQFAPIVGSILAVLVLLSGIGLHLHLKKNTYYTETANFDFFSEVDDIEWQEEQSFIQRVRYLLWRERRDEFGETRTLLR